MVSVGRHKNITLLTYSEVEDVSGVVGDFRVIVRKKARYVNEDLCNGCGTCVEKCPWKKIPDEFEFGLGNRPAIHFQYPQAVPKIPRIDAENCAYFKNGKCKACEKFCQRGAIDFEQQDEMIEFDVGTIILATGFKDFNPNAPLSTAIKNLKMYSLGWNLSAWSTPAAQPPGESGWQMGTRPKDRHHPLCWQPGGSK